MDFNSAILGAFESLTPDINGIYNDAHTYRMSDWQALQSTLVTASGAGATLIPGLHLVGMAADVVFLMNRMATCSYGIGAIMGNQRNLGNVLEEEDFGIVLSRWAGAEEVSDAALAKLSAEAATATGKVAAKSLAKFAAKKTGILIGKKLAGKAGAKIGAKFGAKIGGKAAGGFIPFLGAVIGGGINLYFISSVSEAARGWYEFKTSNGANETGLTVR